MYPNLGPGMMIDLEPEPAGGVEVLLSHEFVRVHSASQGTTDCNLYRYVGNDPIIYVDPDGRFRRACSVQQKCTGGCIKGKDVKIKSCTVTKLERQPGSDFLCRAVTKDRICIELKKMVEGPGDEWLINKCNEGCDCGEFVMSNKSGTLTLTEQIIDQQGKVTGVGELHCIFKVSGTIILEKGYLGVSPCVPKPKECRCPGRTGGTGDA